MSIEIWIGIIALIIIAILFFQNKDKKEQVERLISNHKYEKEKLDNEILSLKILSL
jgi:hypothetical protein